MKYPNKSTEIMQESSCDQERIYKDWITQITYLSLNYLPLPLTIVISLQTESSTCHFSTLITIDVESESQGYTSSGPTQFLKTNDFDFRANTNFPGFQPVPAKQVNKIYSSFKPVTLDLFTIRHSPFYILLHNITKFYKNEQYILL